MDQIDARIIFKFTVWWWQNLQNNVKNNACVSRNAYRSYAISDIRGSGPRNFEIAYDQ